MKYRDENGDFQDLYFKTGDTLPIGTEVDYDGETAPAGWEEIDNPEEYSTSEVKTNKIWIDGKPIYRKVLSIPLTGTYQESGKFWTWKSDSNIATIDTLITSVIYCTGTTAKINSQSDSSLYCTLIHSGAHEGTWQVGALLTEFDNTSVALLTIEYTKTTD